MQEALESKKSAFNELSSYAGSGNAEAQYYHYTMRKRMVVNKMVIVSIG